MSAALLRADHDGQGLSGRINRGFERLKRAYGRALDFTLASRPAVYTSWVVLEPAGRECCS
jgi:multidrug efflux pump